MPVSCRYSSLDVLKCVAVFFVVNIHCGPVFPIPGFLTPFVSASMELVDPLIRMAVPMFFIITGYYYPVMMAKGEFGRHLRKMIGMVLCTSFLYGVFKVWYFLLEGKLDVWLSDIFAWRNIVNCILYDRDLFSGHLWYFWAVIYDLVVFYLADKYHLTKHLRRVVPVLLLMFFAANFTPGLKDYTRNFLFFGLPCMMIGRWIAENRERFFSFFRKGWRGWTIMILSFFFSIGEMLLLHHLYGNGDREMYLFSLPCILPVFHWALRHPDFGKGSWAALIGRRYSAYIYMFHIMVFYGVSYFANFGELVPGILQPLVLFLLALSVSAVYVWGKETVLGVLKKKTVRK